MGVDTRSNARNYGSEANSTTPSSKGVMPPSSKQKLPTAKAGLSTSIGANLRDSKNFGSAPQKIETSKKRIFVGSEESEEIDEDTGTHPTNTTPSKRRETNVVVSPTSKNSNKSAVAVIPPRDIKKIQFPSLEDMALKDFIKVLAGKGINARKVGMQEFNKLEVDGSEHQTKVCWKSVTGSKPSLIKLPDTAKFGKCSVFAVKASTKESFERKAKEFLGNNMGSKTLERSMALVLHYDGDDKLQSAIVGYPMGRCLHYCDSLRAETADKIAMELNRGKNPERWHLEVQRKMSSKRRRLVDTSNGGSAQDKPYSSSD